MSRFWTALAWIGIAAAFYVGTYYCLVYELTLPGGMPPRQLSPWYRVGGRASCVIFSPVHALDRRLRPNYWTDYGPGRRGGGH